MDIELVVKEIQFVVAPAVMVSGSALLLLGFQNKFSNLASRFRSLNHERRELTKKTDPHPGERERLDSLFQQIGHLVMRATHVKNAILLSYGAIVLFLLTSVLIFFHAHGAHSISAYVVTVFLAGLFLELLACLIMTRETALAFKIIHLESVSLR